MRILLVEDDTLIGDGIKAGLSKMGFSVDWFTEGRPGKEALYSAPYDAVILDLTLPGMDGRDILREWREKGKQEPVLILTARDALAERVEGLRLGADDYLCKPFALIEVAARLEALVRRASGQASSELRHGQVTLNPGNLVATLAGEPLALNQKSSRCWNYYCATKVACCRASLLKRSCITGMTTCPAMQWKSMFIIYAASSAANLFAPYTASATPWVTHEIDATSQPARQADAYFPDSGLHHLGNFQFCGLEKDDG